MMKYTMQYMYARAGVEIPGAHLHWCRYISQRAGSFCPIPALRAGGLPDDKTIQLYCLLAMLVIVLHLALAIASINLHLQAIG